MVQSMRIINQKCAQNVKSIAVRRFPVLDKKASTGVNISGPAFVPISSPLGAYRTAKLFLKTYNHSAGKAGIDGEKTFWGRLSNKFWQKTWARAQSYFCWRGNLFKKNYITEVVKDDDKTLGYYSLYLNKSGDCAQINYFGINPDIKKSKMAVPTLLNMAQRISEYAKSRRIGHIGWSTNKENKRAFMLFDKFPAEKFDQGDYVDFIIPVSDFDKTLKKYM